MTAISESTPNPANRNHLTRRAALRGTAKAIPAIASAAMLPAAAVAATGAPRGDAVARFVQACKERPELIRRFCGIPDPGLAKLEAGYRRWQALYARTMALYEEAEEEGLALDSELYRLNDRRNALRRRLVRIPTRSPRGVMIKIAMGVGATSLDAAAIADASEGNVPIDNLFPALLADLQAMDVRGVA